MAQSRRNTSSLKKLSGAKVLVTGAGGFIGSHLTEFLCELGADVTALFRYTSGASCGALANSRFLKEIKKEFGDIRDPETCARIVKKQEYIFHLAAQVAIPYSYLAPRDFVAVNVNGTANLLQPAIVAKNLQCFLYMSTSEVYGSAQKIPIDETHPLAPQSPYAATKASAELLARSYALSYDLPVTTVRTFNTVGPRQSPRAVIPTIISQALHGRSLKLGETSTSRDFLYISDTVRGLALAAVSAKTNGRTLNLCTGEETKIKSVVSHVGEILERKLAVTRDNQRVRPKASEVTRLCGCGKLAYKLCKFSPAYSLVDGLRETINWMRTNESGASDVREYRI